MKDFKVLLPGMCNARCSFCFGASKEIPTTEQQTLWVSGLRSAFRQATEDYQKLNISGAEPTLSPVFTDTLNAIRAYRHKFTKVVLTSNGFNLSPSTKLRDAVDFLNISRHSHDDYTNKKIFGTNAVPDKEEVGGIIHRANKQGIECSLSMVITGYSTTAEDLINMIKFGKDVGASAIRVRNDFNKGLTASVLENQFLDYTAVHEDACPACRVKKQIINGMPIYWVLGVPEPSNVVDYVYEVLYNERGKLVLDYAGNKPFEFKPLVDRRPRIIDAVFGGGCGVGRQPIYGGCGVRRMPTSGC